MHLRSKQAGFHVIMLVVAIVAIVGVGAAGYLVLQKQGDKSGANSTAGDTSNPDDPNGPPLKIKHIGIEIDAYDPTTNKAGDLVFIKTGLESYDNLLFFDYGAIA